MPLVANYSSGSLAVFEIRPDGSIGPAKILQHQGSGPDKSRQEGPHVHCADLSPDQRFVASCDLGLDRIFVYPFNGNEAGIDPTPVHRVAVQPASGPRHLAFARQGPRLYQIAELAWHHQRLRLQPRDGRVEAEADDLHGSGQLHGTEMGRRSAPAPQRPLALRQRARQPHAAAIRDEDCLPASWRIFTRSRAAATPRAISRSTPPATGSPPATKTRPT